MFQMTICWGLCRQAFAIGRNPEWGIVIQSDVYADAGMDTIVDSPGLEIIGNPSKEHFPCPYIMFLSNRVALGKPLCFNYPQ